MNKLKDRLHHQTPQWVDAGAIFHIRIRVEDRTACSLVVPQLASLLLESARNYHAAQRWNVHLFLLMPDHLHALLSFPMESGMSKTIRSWKAYHARHSSIVWQANYFDHRIRSSAEFDLKAAYVRNNPVAGGLCAIPEEWPWVIAAPAADV